MVTGYSDTKLFIDCINNVQCRVSSLIMMLEFNNYNILFLCLVVLLFNTPLRIKYEM